MDSSGTAQRWSKTLLPQVGSLRSSVKSTVNVRGTEGLRKPLSEPPAIHTMLVSHLPHTCDNTHLDHRSQAKSIKPSKLSSKFFPDKQQPRNPDHQAGVGGLHQSPLHPAPEAPSQRGSPAPKGLAAAAVLTSRKRFQYLSRSYWETVLSHWSLSRKLPLLGPAPPASASRCRLSTWRKHAAAAAASTAIAGICGQGARRGVRREGRAGRAPRGAPGSRRLCDPPGL